MSLKIVFMGTPDFAIPTLAKILDEGHEVAAVYTQPPRPAGRGGKMRKTPVHEFAEKKGLKVLTPKSLKKPAAIEEMKAHGADLGVVIAYGLILPKSVLEAFPKGCLNVHGSLLPRWRGAAPIQRALMAGDEETGVMIMAMDEGLDTGDVLLTRRIPLPEEMTAGQLHDEMMHEGAALLAEALVKLETGALTPVPQSAEGATYAEKILKTETKIDWSKPVRDIHNHSRGLSPFPGAWFEMQVEGGKKERVKLLKTAIADQIKNPISRENGNLLIRCKDGALQILEVQREGKKPMMVKDFLNGLPGEFKILP